MSFISFFFALQSTSTNCSSANKNRPRRSASGRPFRCRNTWVSTSRPSPRNGPRLCPRPLDAQPLVLVLYCPCSARRRTGSGPAVEGSGAAGPAAGQRGARLGQRGVQDAGGPRERHPAGPLLQGTSVRRRNHFLNFNTLAKTPPPPNKSVVECTFLFCRQSFSVTALSTRWVQALDDCQGKAVLELD